MQPEKKMIKAFFTILLILCLPITAGAIGQTTDPIVINNALRGKEYQQTMIVVNTEKTDAKIGFSAEGQIGEWAHFYKLGDLKTEFGGITMKPGEVRNVSVVFKIPDGTPNGKYKGFVSAVKRSDSDGAIEGSGSAVSQKINREVTITVNDKESVAFEVSVIPQTYDLKNDELLSIRLIYDNRGNVSIAPQAQIKIKNETETIHNSIYPYPESETPVKPGEIREIPAIVIPTSKLEKGKYMAEMAFSEGGEIIYSKNFEFSIGIYDVGSTVGAASEVGNKSVIKITGNMNLLAGIILGLAVIMAISLMFRRNLQKVKNDDGKNTL